MTQSYDISSISNLTGQSPGEVIEELISRNETLEAENAALHNEVAELSSALEAALSKIAELESRTTKNSQNSNKPPSSDGYSKKPKRKPAFPREKGKKQEVSRVIKVKHWSKFVLRI